MEFLFELNTRKETPYLQATMNCFVYHRNTIALYWQEKPTSECVALTLKMKKNTLNHDYRNNNGRNFKFTRFSFIDFVLCPGKRRPISASGKSSGCRFSLSAERNANTKATEYVTFGFYLVYWFSSPSRRTSLSVSDTDSFVFFIIRTKCKQLVFRILKALPFIHQPDWVAPKASDVSTVDWLYRHTWKNIVSEIPV